MYGAETWAVKKAQEKKLDVAEPSWTELGMKELEGQQRWEKYSRKCKNRTNSTCKFFLSMYTFIILTDVFIGTA